MKLCLFDQGVNDWLTAVYFVPLQQYARDIGKPIEAVNSLDDCRNCGVIAHGSHLMPDVIVRLKNNGCRVFSFDINDSSFLYEQSYAYGPEMEMLDIIWKFSGIQKTNGSLNGLKVDPDFSLHLVTERFIDERNWPAYNRMRESGKLRSLPYVPRLLRPNLQPPFAAREKKVLIRGGSHYWRVLLFFKLIQQGLLASQSSFNVGYYYNSAMRGGFRYCDECIAQKHHGGIHYARYESRQPSCTSPCDWSMSTHASQWNNRCAKAYFWLSDQFEKKFGPLDRAPIQIAFNGNNADDQAFASVISSSVFYADFKWPFSIFAPPRFWEAASSKTISLYPRRTNDQAYFPDIQDGVHYVTFSEDLTNLADHIGINEARYSDISNACHDLYRHWIVGTTYLTSTNLLKHIHDAMMESCAEDGR